jgi:large subunit ribosomal protein L17
VRHADTVKKLGRTKQHRRAMLRNLVAQLFHYERIRTTLPKAKETRRYAERLIGFAKKGTVAARREVAMSIADKTLIKKLFDVIGPRFTERPGGYTRILKLGPRDGDGAEMAILELVVREERHKEKAAKEAAAKEKGGRKPKAAKQEKKPADKPGTEK